jgi:hypothetical protein
MSDAVFRIRCLPDVLSIGSVKLNGGQHGEKKEFDKA